MSALAIATMIAVSAWLAWPEGASGRLVRIGIRVRQAPDEMSLSQAIIRWSRGLPIGPWHRRRRAMARMRLIEALGGLAAELAAGQPPEIALERAAGEPPAWPTALAAVRLHAGIPDALRVDASRMDPTQQALLGSVAACWEAAESSGSGLSAAIGRIADSARRSEEVRLQLEGELAAPRATARLLAVLPVFGVLIGSAVGIDPLSWLVGSPVGWGCLLGALALTGVGMAWTARIAAGVEGRL